MTHNNPGSPSRFPGGPPPPTILARRTTNQGKTSIDPRARAAVFAPLAAPFDCAGFLVWGLMGWWAGANPGEPEPAIRGAGADRWSWTPWLLQIDSWRRG